MLAASDTSGLQVMASHELGGGGEVLAVTEQGELEEGQPWLLATSDTPQLQRLVRNFTFSVFGQVFLST